MSNDHVIPFGNDNKAPLPDVKRVAIDSMSFENIAALGQWLSDACHQPNADSAVIMREFFKKSNQMRRCL